MFSKVLSSKFILKQLHYSLSISMRDSWQLWQFQLSRYRERKFWLFNRNTILNQSTCVSPRVPLFCSYHILKSSVIYYWTDAQQHGIYLLNGGWSERSHPQYTGEIQLGQGNPLIIVTSSFSKSFVLKMFTVHTKTRSQCFQIPPFRKAFS